MKDQRKRPLPDNSAPMPQAPLTDPQQFWARRFEFWMELLFSNAPPSFIHPDSRSNVSRLRTLAAEFADRDAALLYDHILTCKANS